MAINSGLIFFDIFFDIQLLLTIHEYLFYCKFLLDLYNYCESRQVGVKNQGKHKFKENINSSFMSLLITQ